MAQKDLPPGFGVEIDGIQQGAVDVEDGRLVSHASRIGGTSGLFNKKDVPVIIR